MNPRIKELWEQATIKTTHKYYTWGNSIATETKEVFDKEKFVELIVRECRDTVSATRDQAIEDGWNVDEAMSTAMFDIEEHFGIIP